MAATSIACPECGSPVSYGRLSCPSCGTLLASVAGARPIDRTATAAGAPSDGPTAVDPTSPDPAPEPAPSAPPVLRDWDERGDAGPGVDAPAAAPAPSILRDWPDDAPSVSPESMVPAAAPAAPAAPADATDATGATHPDHEPSLTPAPEVSAPDPDSVEPGDRSPSPSRTPAPPPAAPSTQGGPVLAGAYLAPSASYASPAVRPVAAPAPTTIPSLAATPVAATAGVAAGSPATASVDGPPASRRALAVPAELAEWLSIGGSVLVIVSFVLPWATDGVIGARGSGYTSDWGLANPGHLVLVGATLAVLLLHVIPNRVPRWIRSGLLPLLVGGILVGLAFAYYARPFGGGTGIAVELAGALILVLGGLLGIRSERTEPPPSTV